MASEMGLSVVGKIVEMMVEPIVAAVTRQFSYMFRYKRNIQTLSDELARLEASRESVQLRTAEAERNLEIVAPAVKLWLTKVDEMKSKAAEVHEGTFNVEKGCVNGWCPNLKRRYLLSRKATKLTEGIGKLKGEGDKDAKFSHSAPPRGIISSEAPPISAMDDDDDAFEGFATRISNMNEVMDAIKEDGINLIGISGMGGVGKTTLVNQVVEKVKAQRLFNEVAMAVVSQKPDLEKIQGEIAEMLGLGFKDGSSTVERAERLCKRLKGGGRVLIVLDDIWEGIDLGEVGIPTGNGCKVVFTTRMERACTMMAAQRHIKVQILSDQEAWHLFQAAAGECVKNEELHDIAKEVANECGGLPIAIVTLGKALSKREKYEWEDTMLQLKKSSGMEERVQSSIMLSYNFLESRRPNAQPLLLLCSLFPEDENIPIEQLVKYSMGLELFDDVETLEETRNRVHTLVNNLKSSNLLLQGNQDDNVYVRLHDVVRDVCLLVASGPQHAYLVRHELKLKQWPRQNKQKAHSAIALMSGAMNKLPAGLEYPNLRLLQLQLHHENIDIDKEFFQGMRGLQVFNFHGVRYGNVPRSNVLLPPTLQLLTNLQALSLEFCILGGDVSSIGCLKELKILSFFKSKLDEFPREVAQLKNLKLLDLRFERCTLNIETTLLSPLDQLEVLFAGNYIFSSIKELKSLSSLTTLQIGLSNSMILLELEEPFFEKLKRFDVTIGRVGGYSCGHGIVKNNIALREGEYLSWFSNTKLRSLVKKTQSLELTGCTEERVFIDEMDEACNPFDNLESLDIQVMFVNEICLTSNTANGSFHRLQELCLAHLPELKHLRMGTVEPPSFGNLRVLRLESCYLLECLFSPNVAKCMVQLEKIQIIECYELEGLISNQGEGDDKRFEKIQFPKLKSFLLRNSVRFSSFYPESGKENLEGDSGIIQSLFNQRVSFPSLEEIELELAESIELIMGYQMHDGPANKLRSITVCNCAIKNLVSSKTLENLEEVQISDCDSMEVVFDMDGLKVGGEDSPFIFDKLASIKLESLENLAYVWRMVPDGIQGFRNLRILELESCNELIYLLSYSVAKMLVNLQVLKLENCPEIVGVIEGEDEEISNEAKSNECIVFPHLRILVLNGLDSFTSFCSSKYSLEFPLLKEVEIVGCPDMECFCSGDVKAPVLEEPIEDPSEEQWIWEGNLNNGSYRGKRETEDEDSDDDIEEDEAEGNESNDVDEHEAEGEESDDDEHEAEGDESDDDEHESGGDESDDVDEHVAEGEENDDVDEHVAEGKESDDDEDEAEGYESDDVDEDDAEGKESDDDEHEAEGKECDDDEHETDQGKENDNINEHETENEESEYDEHEGDVDEHEAEGEKRDDGEDRDVVNNKSKNNDINNK